MRELSVYYCRICGHYAYFQLPKNAVCHRCNSPMTLMNMPYQNFMDLGYEERDRLISQQIIESSSSLVERICAPDKIYNKRQIIGQLTHQVTELEEENKRLNDTVSWMHDTIWEQLRKAKAMEKEISELKEQLKASQTNLPA